MGDVLITFLVTVVGVANVVLLSKRLTLLERRVLLASTFLHISLALALRWMLGNYYTEGDLGQFRVGSDPLVGLMLADPVRWVPEVLKLLLHMGPGDSARDSTMSMIAFTAFGRVLLFDSLYGLCAALSLVTMAARWAIYVCLRDSAPRDGRGPLLFAVLLTPSMVFWAGGLMKEALATVGLGALTYGVRRVVLRLEIGGLLLAAAGGVCVALFKAYFLFPYALAVAVWMVSARSTRARRYLPFYLVGALALGVVSVAALGSLFPRYSLDKLASSTAELRANTAAIDAASNYTIIGNDDSLVGQLSYAPIATVTVLARPLPFEAHNLTSGLAALEMSAMLLALIVAVVRARPAGFFRTLRESPVLLFALIFALVSAAPIGLATTNFGTLSRYRAPIIPFYAGFVAILFAKYRRAPAPRAAVVRLPRAPRPGPAHPPVPRGS